MIDLTELKRLVEQYLATRERTSATTLGPTSHRELASVQLDEFLTWLKGQQGEQHRLKNSYSMPRKNAPLLHTQECSCGQSFCAESEEEVRRLLTEHVEQRGEADQQGYYVATHGDCLITHPKYSTVIATPKNTLRMSVGEDVEYVALFSSPQTPRWSSTLPTESGWYWCREGDDKGVVYIFLGDGLHQGKVEPKTSLQNIYKGGTDV